MMVIRRNLMIQPGYTPYCGSVKCYLRMPRTKFNGQQFQCRCGWSSQFPDEFIAEYKLKWEIKQSVTNDTADVPLFCARCGRATTKIELLNRVFNIGFSGCCDDNLLYRHPATGMLPRPIGYHFEGERNVVHPQDGCGAAGAIQPVEVLCPMDEFENHIREMGVISACEWFGHAPDSEFTADTIRVLVERSEGVKR